MSGYGWDGRLLPADRVVWRLEDGTRLGEGAYLPPVQAWSALYAAAGAVMIRRDAMGAAVVRSWGSVGAAFPVARLEVGDRAACLLHRSSVHPAPGPSGEVAW